MIGRIALLAWIALAGQSACAFTTRPSVSRVPITAAWAGAKEAVEVDVSIPYDAAARLAYDEWRDQYNKGGFDAKRYEAFQANYNAITVANVSAKKKARETGEEPRLMSMNEFGDCTAEEYKAAQSKSEKPSSTGGVLDKAAAAVESQSAASTALGDAAAALAEEEEALAKKLGYDSVDELEVAMDTMEGVAEDGGELTDGLAREARIRSAYIQWCKDYGKEPDEARFPTFSSNFLAMEEYAAESGKEMSLNIYADMTEEEYLAATSKAPEPAPAPKAAPPPAPVAKVKTEAEKKAEEAAAAKKKAEAEAKAKKEAEAKKKAQLAAEAARKETEQERSARQAAQAKALEKTALENEAAAIAAAKEAAEREAKQVAQRRAMDEKAAEMERQRAAEFEKKRREELLKQQEKQKAQAMKAREAARARAADKKEKGSAAPFLGSMFKAPEPKKEKKSAPSLDLGSMFKAPEPKKEKKLTLSLDLGSVFKAPEPKEEKKPTLSLDLGSVFKAPEPKEEKKRSPVVKAAPKKKPSPSISLGSIFGGEAPAKKPVGKKPVAAPKPKPIEPVATSDPVTDAFSSIFGVSKKPDPKSASAPVAKKEPFSFFSKPKTTPKPAPSPKPAPVGKKPAFSMFGSPAKKAKPAPAPAPAPKAKTSFSMFGSPKKAPVPAPAPALAKKPSLSFFGGPAKAAPKKAPVAKAGSVRGTLAIPKKEKSNNFGFSFGGAKKVATESDSIPVLKNFVQNPDGSLTGRVSGSKNYKNGTKITTSPVRRGVKAGQTVKTGSGSQYRLE